MNCHNRLKTGYVEIYNENEENYFQTIIFTVKEFYENLTIHMIDKIKFFLWG